MGDKMRNLSAYLEDGPRPPDGDLDPKVALEILRAVGDISFGSVEVVVHDSKVVQIERKEKIRFASEGQARKR